MVQKRRKWIVDIQLFRDSLTVQHMYINISYHKILFSSQLLIEQFSEVKEGVSVELKTHCTFTQL